MTLRKPPRRPDGHIIPDPERDLARARDLMAGQEDPSLLESAGHLSDKAESWKVQQMLSALERAAGEILGQTDLRSIAREILEISITTLGADRGVVFIGRGAPLGFSPLLAMNVRGEELEQLDQISRTILERGKHGEILLIADASVDPDLQSIESVRAKQIHSVLCLPLRASDQMVGLLYLDAPSRSGAFPANTDRFLQAFSGLAGAALRIAQERADTSAELQRLRRQAGRQTPLERVITVNTRMRGLLERAALAARVQFPVLLIGEPGTGKSLLAHTIFEASARAAHPMIRFSATVAQREVRAAALRSLLIEADHGAILVDDPGDLDALLQGKLAGLVDPGGLRIGSGSRRRLDVRLFLTCGPDDPGLKKMTERLATRTHVIEFRLPPLRERTEDLPLLLEHFLDLHSVDHARRRTDLMFPPESLEFLQRLPWPGNVGQLETFVRRVLASGLRGTISVDYLRQLLSLPAARWQPTVELSDAGTPGRIRSIEEREREAIQEALLRTRGIKTKAARILGVHRNTLLRKLRELGLPQDTGKVRRRP